MKSHFLFVDFLSPIDLYNNKIYLDADCGDEDRICR